MHSIISLKSTINVLVDSEKQLSKKVYFDLLKSSLTKDIYIGIGTFYWINSDGNQELLQTLETNLTFAEFDALDSTTPSGTALDSYVAAVKYIQHVLIKNGNFYGLAANQWVINNI